jgi:hypothetical protein
VRSRFVIDASGKGGVLGGRKRSLAPPALALYAYWRDTTLTGAQTRIEAGSHHWYWGAPLPDGTVNATVFVAPESCRQVGKAHLRLAYTSFLASSELLAGCLAGRMVTPLGVCSASASVVEVPMGLDWLKVGEAALTIDPLSSQGVVSALQGGIQGAAVVHTLLSAPAQAAAAQEFYCARLKETAARHAALAAEHYRTQALVSPSPFWQGRAGLEPPPLRAVASPPPYVLDPDHKFTVARATQVIQTPVLCGDLVQLEQAVMHPHLQRPVAYLEGISLVPLLHDVAASSSVRNLLARWVKKVPFPQALRILVWLCERGLIEPTT